MYGYINWTPIVCTLFLRNLRLSHLQDQNTHMHAQAHTHWHIYTHIHVHMYMHTYAHKHTKNTNTHIKTKHTHYNVLFLPCLLVTGVRILMGTIPSFSTSSQVSATVQTTQLVPLLSSTSTWQPLHNVRWPSFPDPSYGSVVSYMIVCRDKQQ